MINERLLEIAKEQFRNDIRNDLLFTVGDLTRAVLVGCNTVTGGKQHDAAQTIVDDFTRQKDKDLVYTEGDMLKAFEYGCRVMSNIVDKENEKVKMSMVVKKQDLQKAMKLISSGQQMMDLAKQFCDEAAECLTKQGEYRTGIKNDSGKLKNQMRQIYSQVKRVYYKFSPDEACDWAEDADKLEGAVRDIFKIDVFEDMNYNTK